ncbi:ImmA/IrrE family metallo-endopeptidase [Erwinia sp. E602]|uniref:helix-turn-helix domain-containing protein n=1 Tax=unclassified Erwinia TaxID=2622719 RepID=UPI000701358A|nr:MULTISPECIES: XRE family transcriptional regulator [unclassified Erwinia]KQN53781.1 transcriptional regulator [Erwinia sp. Leaf53]PLV62265.1 transcriptional regulator [Erwinia sp. B116]QUG73841.1 ImmA/IrrE family metallo-endopeptidase [Erwinia sp. E602]
MIGERLLRARSAAGLSMQALGEAAGVSANMIKKYEHNQNMPSSGVLLKLAKALNVRSEYFFRPYQVELKGIEYRKRVATPVALLKRIEADVIDQAERWLELANLWPTFPVTQFVPPRYELQYINDWDDIETLAGQLRDSWQLGSAPIADLIDLLETRGILVIVTDIGKQTRFDGLQADVAGKPAIIVSSNWPGDRQRFTLAHELGHLLLQGRLSADMDEEKACNRFAAAFLLPACCVRQQTGQYRHQIEFRELYLLKQEYGISMAACLYRLLSLGIISPALHKKLVIHFARQGWRSTEPGTPYPQENTFLFQQLVYRALGEDIIGEAKAAELLGLSLSSFHQARKLEPPHETINQ